MARCLGSTKCTLKSSYTVENVNSERASWNVHDISAYDSWNGLKITQPYTRLLLVIFATVYHWPNTFVTILKRIVGFLNRVQAQRVLILYFCFFFQDNKVHNVYDKDAHYQNSITKPHTRLFQKFSFKWSRKTKILNRIIQSKIIPFQVKFFEPEPELGSFAEILGHCITFLSMPFESMIWAPRMLKICENSSFVVKVTNC